MLYLISTGLYDEKDMSLRAVETAKKCDVLYAEFYTDRTGTDIARLGKTIGKKITEIERKELEENIEKIIKEAKIKDVGILVGGDALTATTHASVLLAAKEAGVKCRVIHGSSVLTAVGETGLQLYKFGKTATLTRNFEKSIYETIQLNKKLGLHTLVLLDIGMTAADGLKILAKKMQDEVKVVVACSLGMNETIEYKKIKNLVKNKNLDKTPAVIIIPGKLHFMEEELLEAL